jgi:hypothetical protein
VDFSKLKPGDWLIGGGTLVFLISMFLPWYKAEAGLFEVSANGWEYTLQGWLPLLLLIGATVLVVVPKLQPSVKIPETVGPLPRLQLALILCAAAAALVLLRLIIKDGDDGFGVEISRGIGLFLALLASLAATAGAFLKFSGKEPEAAGPGTGPATPF